VRAFPVRSTFNNGRLAASQRTTLESLSVQQIVRHLMATHHDPAKPHKGINGADPFVIAMAKDGGAQWKVVADEHPGSLENRKIPGRRAMHQLSRHDARRRLEILNCVAVWRVLSV
jgi:hypothetical protein